MFRFLSPLKAAVPQVKFLSGSAFDQAFAISWLANSSSARTMPE